MKYIAAVLFAALLLVAVRAYRTDAAYDEMVRTAQDTIAVLERVAERLVAEHDSALVVAGHALQYADSMAGLRPRLVTRIDTVTVPEAAIPFTAPRDTLIAVLTLEADSLRSVVRSQATALDRLHEANARLTTSVRLLNNTLNARPGGRWWRPRTGVGGFAGLCISGPCVGVGVTVDIDIPFL